MKLEYGSDADALLSDKQSSVLRVEADASPAVQLWSFPRRDLRRGPQGVVLSLATRRLLLIMLGLVAVSWATTFFPTQHELYLVYANNLSLFSLSSLRAAQLLANSQSAKLLNRSNSANEPTDGCEVAVVIVRHCEGGDVFEHCAHVGYKRSVYLATLFGDNQERWPTPNFIFAQSPGERKDKEKLNFREIETVGPLAEKAGVVIDDSFSTLTANDLAKEFFDHLHNGKMCGKLTVISWKHSDIGHLARQLACGPEQGCPLTYSGMTFDDAWQIIYSYHKPEHSSQRNLRVPTDPQWMIVGNVQAEGFDPLSFSKQVGDYTSDGKFSGVRWKDQVVSYPERIKSSHAKWQATRVGFEEHRKSSKK